VLKIKPYWVETGHTNFINEALWASEPSTQGAFEKIIQGAKVNLQIEKDIDYKLISTSRSIWSLLFFGGYITGTMVGSDLLEARVPNTEVMGELRKIWNRYFDASSARTEVQHRKWAEKK